MAVGDYLATVATELAMPVSLAVADCLVLVASVPNEIVSYYLVGNQWLWGDVGCAAFVFCQNLGINASALSLVAFTVERYIAICRPLRAHALCSVSRAQRISLLAWALAAAYSSPWLALASTRPLRYRGLPDLRACDFRLPRAHYLLYFFCDLLAFYVAPLLLSCVLYALIARALFRRGAATLRRTATAKFNFEQTKELCWANGFWDSVIKEAV
ncbi:thyrotropin-releasing hormone receptor-like [Schistocerca nitens]|uniref:thyrotropin-releasing hormone receptor-like n=1 Tax=Schistocerca nitens TaxID=7011 RepID=UPI002119B25A|nr:thyrotropin-releasing hormone receptor-like [Schistocerca nitens]